MADEFPIQDADLCVKCGLCAPHCPTYALDQIEPESPRGRIAVMAALAAGQIEASDTAREHLDHCLGCQACEAVCPAQVPYLKLLDASREQLRPQSPTPDRFVRSLVTLDLLRPLLRLQLKLLVWLRAPLLPLSKRLGLSRLGRLLSLIPAHPRWRQPPRRPRPDLQLFVGCLGDLANGAALDASLRVLRALNLRADVIPAQNCCGALAQHRGDASAAARAQGKLQRVLREDLPIIGLDSACVLQLRAQGFDQAQELCAFLAKQNWPPLRPPEDVINVLIHQPCSQRNGLREIDSARRLLAQVPGLELHDMSQQQCCGAAGLHMLDYPQRADALLQAKLNDANGMHYLSSTNVGCALHLAAGLRRRGLQAGGGLPKVCHPVELIAKALP